MHLRPWGGVLSGGDWDFLVFFFLLLGPQRRVGARGGQERLVGAALGNFSVLDDQDLVGVDHGGQLVGDDQHRRPMGNLGQVFLDHAFGD